MPIKTFLIIFLLLIIGCNDTYDEYRPYGGERSLYIIHADGSGLQEIFQENGQISNLQFLPDGSGVVFEARGDLSGTFLYQVATGEIIPYEDPSSPDSVWIDYDWSGEIYLINSVIPDTVNLTNDDKYQYDPVLTADHRSVIFLEQSSYEEEGYFGIKLVVIDINSRERTEIARFVGSAELLIYPPDRSLIIYNFANGWFNQLWLLETGSLNIKKLCDTFSTYCADIDSGKTAIVLEAFSGDNMEIFMIDLASYVKTKLTDSPGADLRPKFSPDGSKILFEYRSDDKSSLYIMDRYGANLKQLSPEHSYIGDYCASPDNCLIAFTCED